MINPNEVDLLKNFLLYLEDNDLMIIKDVMFKTNKSWHNTKPKRGDTAHINIHYESKFPSTAELDDRIDLFLKNYKKK